MRSIGVDIVSGAITSRLQVAAGEVVDIVCSPIEPLIGALIHHKEVRQLSKHSFMLSASHFCHF
jgi:hypothetical protein